MALTEIVRRQGEASGTFREAVGSFRFLFTGLMAYNKKTVSAACRHLRRQDPVRRRIIDEVGPFTLRGQRDRFRMLVRSIISQQISVSAARSIRTRLEQLVAPQKIAPHELKRLSLDELRSVGLSRQKANYLHDLSDKTADNTIALRTIGRKSDQEIVETLTQVKGIGVWTAQMFLIFSLERVDVFPADDLGIRAAIRHHYELGEMPDRKTSHRIAEPWRPYASIASWYCWRSLESKE